MQVLKRDMDAANKNLQQAQLHNINLDLNK